VPKEFPGRLSEDLCFDSFFVCGCNKHELDFNGTARTDQNLPCSED